MIKWHSTHYKLIMQNPNIDAVSLSKLIGVSRCSLIKMRNKLAIKGRANRNFNFGIRYLRFDISDCVYIVKARVNGIEKHVGSSAIFEKAVEILDKYLFEVKQGFIKL